MKFRKLTFVGIIIIIYDILAFGCFLLPFLAPSKQELWIYIVSLIMFVICPILLSIYIFSFAFDTIDIEKDCVKQYHFGKLKKTLKWADIVTSSIYKTSPYCGWIYLSDCEVSYNFWTCSFMHFDKRSICMFTSEEVVNELNKYLINKINK